MVVCRLKFAALIKKGRIKNKVNPFMNQPTDMPMRQFRRITFGFAGDRFDAKRINIMVGQRGEDHLIPKFCKKSKPERVIFIHVQYPGDTYPPPFCHIGGKRFITENPL